MQKPKKFISLPKWSQQQFFLVSVLLCITSIVVMMSGMMYQLCHPIRIDNPQVDGVKKQIPVTSGSAEVIVDSLQTGKGQAPYIAPAGSHYVLVGIIIKNISTQPINITPSLDTYLKQTNGTIDYLSPTDLAQPLRSGILLPGETIKGQLSYLTKSQAPYYLYIQSDWTSTVIKFMLE